MIKIFMITILMLNASSAFGAESEMELARFEKQKIYRLHSIVMAQKFDLSSAKNQLILTEYLKALVRVSSQSANHFMGSYIAELVDEKNMSTDEIWSRVKTFATKTQFAKLQKDYDDEMRSSNLN